MNGTRSGQQTIFFLTSFILFFTGNGLYPLLPLFAGGFGAGPATIGVFLASLSASNAVGAVAAGRLLARFAPRTLYVAAGALGVPALLLLALADAMWLVVLGTTLAWFVGGFVMTLVSVLTGLTVAPEARGRAFSRLFLASPLGAILGGGALGALVDGLGYAPGFVVLAVMWTAIPLLGLRLARVAPAEPDGPAAPSEVAAPSAAAAPLGGSFYLLLVSALAVAAALHTRNVAAFLQMQEAGFSAAAIGSTTVTAGVVTIPVALFGGSLSDRVGRRTLMLATTALAALTLVFMAGAGELWQFAAGLALLLAATAVLRPATTAIATDLLPPAALQRGLPLIEAGTMGVGIAAAAGAGYALERFGVEGVTVVSAALLLLSALALGLLCSRQLVGAVCPAPVQRMAFWPGRTKASAAVRPAAVTSPRR